MKEAAKGAVEEAVGQPVVLRDIKMKAEQGMEDCRSVLRKPSAFRASLDNGAEEVS